MPREEFLVYLETVHQNSNAGRRAVSTKPPAGLMPTSGPDTGVSRLHLSQTTRPPMMVITGRMFASEHWNVEPDILCLAKGIASGMPLGAIVARADVMDWPPGAHASTFGGNPVCCAAALETIALLQEGLTVNAAEIGSFLLDELNGLAEDCELIGDVRGKGLMIGVELVKDRSTKERAPAERNEVVQACFRRGLLLLGCGENTIRLAPPLVIDRDQARTAVRILGEAINEVEEMTFPHRAPSTNGS